MVLAMQAMAQLCRHPLHQELQAQPAMGQAAIQLLRVGWEQQGQPPLLVTML
jgi:hypothetical protein